jgi:hypothetical protein
MTEKHSETDPETDQCCRTSETEPPAAQIQSTFVLPLKSPTHPALGTGYMILASLLLLLALPPASIAIFGNLPAGLVGIAAAFGVIYKLKALTKIPVVPPILIEGKSITLHSPKRLLALSWSR